MPNSNDHEVVPIRTNANKKSAGQAGPAAPKKKTAKKAVKKPSGGSAPKSKGGFMKFILAVVITAVVAGGAVYAWQKRSGQALVSEVRQEAQEEKMSFEQRLQALKARLTGTESEKEELAKKAEELEQRMAILNKAKIDFSDAELGLSFTYPAVFGEVTVTKSQVAGGTKFSGSFSDNDKLVFGGLSANFEFKQTATGTAIEATDTKGYDENFRQTLFLGPGESEYEIEPVETLQTASGEALLINKSSFPVDPEADGLPVNIGENAAAVINLAQDEFPGVAFVNSDFGMFPLESFKGMISTVEIR